MEQRTDPNSLDEMKVVVRLRIFDVPQPENPLPGAQQSSVSESSTTDFEAWVAKGGSIAELKAILESQDLIPEDSEKFEIEVRLTESSVPLPDSFSIPEDTTHIHLTVRPKLIAPQPPSVLSSTTPLPNVAAPTRTESRIPDWPALFASASLLTPTTFNGSQTPGLVRNTDLQSATAPNTSMAAQMEAAQNIMADPNAMRQLMNSPFMRAIMSSPDLLRTIIDSNPQMRELRERNPELNHILNDPQLLRESMEAMQNPSLMREMISNTDRVLRNIDAVPGGFNALRNVYQSIQEPMWDAATASNFGRSSVDGHAATERTYDLCTDRSPSTDVIPSPWATRPSLAAPSRTTNSLVRSSTPAGPNGVTSLGFRPFQSSSSITVARLQPNAQTRQTSQPSVTVPTATLSAAATTTSKRLSLAIPYVTPTNALAETASPLTPQDTSSSSKNISFEEHTTLLEPNDEIIRNNDLNEEATSAEEANNYTVDNSFIKAVKPAAERSNNRLALSSATPSSPLGDVETKTDNSQLAFNDTCYRPPPLLSSEPALDTKDSLCIKHTQQPETTKWHQNVSAVDKTVVTEGNTVIEHQTCPEKPETVLLNIDQNPVISDKEKPTTSSNQQVTASNIPSQTTALPAVGQYPYLYQNVFPSQHRLRALGGLGLPHATHIRGVIRRRPNSDTPPLANTIHNNTNTVSHEESSDSEESSPKPTENVGRGC